MREVWDWVIDHWLLVFTIVLAWLTRHGGGALHEWVGYATLVVIAVHLVRGFLGSTHARFGDLLFSPASVWRSLRDMCRHRARYAGPNPLAGYSIVLLLVAVLFTGLSGWLYTSDRYWGVAWVGKLHDGSAAALGILIALHVAGVIFTRAKSRT